MLYIRIYELMFQVTNLLPDDSSAIFVGLPNPVIVKFVLGFYAKRLSDKGANR